MTVSIERIKSCVCEFYQIDKSKLSEQNRKKEIAKARQIFFYLSYKFCNLSLQKIGQSASRDHATVLFSVNKINVHKEIYSDLKSELSEIEKLITYNRCLIDNVDLLEIAKLNTLQQQYLS